MGYRFRYQVKAPFSTEADCGSSIPDKMFFFGEDAARGSGIPLIQIYLLDDTYERVDCRPAQMDKSTCTKFCIIYVYQ